MITQEGTQSFGKAGTFVQNIVEKVHKFSKTVSKFTPSVNEITQKVHKLLRTYIKFRSVLCYVLCILKEWIHNHMNDPSNIDLCSCFAPTT